MTPTIVTLATVAHEPVLAFGLGYQELIVLAIFGLLIFGKRLPEVGKSLGKSIVEFKKGLHGIEDEINQAATVPPRQADMLPPPTTPAQNTAARETTPQSNEQA
jgi:sec-independent protein translocase protein TatA